MNAVQASNGPDDEPRPGKPRYKDKRVAQQLAQASPKLLDLYEALKATLTGLGDDVQVKILKPYIALPRIKNFASVEVHAGGRRYSCDPSVTALRHSGSTSPGSGSGFSRRQASLGIELGRFLARSSGRGGQQ